MAWDGYPESTEKGGWHWIKMVDNLDCEPMPLWWNSISWDFPLSVVNRTNESHVSPEKAVSKGWGYAGKVSPPGTDKLISALRSAPAPTYTIHSPTRFMEKTKGNKNG